MNNRMYKLSSSFLALWVAFFTLSCDGNKKNYEDKKEDSLPVLSLKIGAMPSMDILPFLVAEEIEAYDSLGLDFEVVKFYSANDRDAALQVGAVDGSVIDYTGAMMQQAAGIPLQLVMKLDGYFMMIARPGFEGVTVEDLKGKTVGVSANTVIDYATDRMTSAAGLEESAIEKVEVNKIPLRMELLRGEKMDATVLPDPFITITTSEGMKALASTEDLGIHVTGLVLSKTTLAEKYEAVNKLIEGYNKGVDYLNANGTTGIEEILTEELGFPEPLISKVRLPKFTHRELPADTDIKAVFDWLMGRGLLPESYKTDSLVTNL